MNESAFSGVVFLPLLPLWAMVAAVVVLAVLGLRAFVQRSRGGILRFLGFAVLFVAALAPSYEREQRRPQDDIALLLVDQSSSQQVGDRAAQRDRAVSDLQATLSQFPDLHVRVVNFGTVSAAGGNENGTLLGQALVNAAAGLPKDRYAGAIVVSDGQIHDADARLGNNRMPNGPLHVLLTGAPDRYDRRVVIVKAPGYGLVGQETVVEFQIQETPSAQTAGQVPGQTTGRMIGATLLIDGREADRQQVPANSTATFAFDLTHAGQSVIEIVAAHGEGELSAINNTGVVTINGVRDRLRVLLVSGQPHAGGRTWRNLLKSDPAVDLVHFTILRPQEKNDFTPIQELALISFPTFELFDMKINQFDLIVFDRYVVRHILSPRYYRNIEDYVLNGGSLMVVVGPEYAGSRSLNETELGGILPASPTGEVFEQGYYPRLSDIGRLHPVTAPLAARAGTGGSVASWGRWFRQVETTPRTGLSLMEGIDGQPLLLLDRQGEGRVGMMTSDHIWLWARGFEGGGPQAELLRRTAHWLMKEPTLEEELLSAEPDGNSLHISRRSLGMLPSHATVTGPDGRTELVELTENGTGQAIARYPADLPGVYRIEDGSLRSLAVVGDFNPLELNDLTATPARLKPYADASGGGLWWLSDGIPEIRRTKPGRDQQGQAWLGLRSNTSYIVTGVDRIVLLPPWLAAGLAAVLLMGAWWREGRSL